MCDDQNILEDGKNHDGILKAYFQMPSACLAWNFPLVVEQAKQVH